MSALVLVEQPDGPAPHLRRAYAWEQIGLAEERLRAATAAAPRDYPRDYGVALLERAFAYQEMADALAASGLPERAEHWLGYAESDRQRAETIGLLAVAYALQVRA